MLAGTLDLRGVVAGTCQVDSGLLDAFSRVGDVAAPGYISPGKREDGLTWGFSVQSGVDSREAEGLGYRSDGPGVIAGVEQRNSVPEPAR